MIVNVLVERSKFVATVGYVHQLNYEFSSVCSSGRVANGVFIPSILLFHVTEQLVKSSSTLRPSV